MALAPILTAHLFPKLEQLLIELLSSLGPADWQAHTVSPKWTVKDVAAHLLDTQLRKLALLRDDFAAERPSINAPADLLTYINRLNDEGVTYFRRLSPALLVSLMELASRQSCAIHEALDPWAAATFPVSWAGERESLNWFDTAREYTERWHHQQQMRLAVNRPGIETAELYHPVLDCFMRALPHSYRDVSAPAGTSLRFDIAGPAGGSWFLERGETSWTLSSEGSGAPAARATIPQEIAWRIFTKGIDPTAARAQIRFGGNTALAERILGTLAIVG
jgi:uncharacterized protein (TIGR03083 family)